MIMLLIYFAVGLIIGNVAAYKDKSVDIMDIVLIALLWPFCVGLIFER